LEGRSAELLHQMSGTSIASLCVAQSDSLEVVRVAVINFILCYNVVARVTPLVSLLKKDVY